jgi:hypothetical protein
MVDMTTVEMTDGKKKPALKTSFRGKNLLFIINASKRAKTVVNGMVPITNTNVFFKAVRKILSLKA